MTLNCSKAYVHSEVLHSYLACGRAWSRTDVGEKPSLGVGEHEGSKPNGVCLPGNRSPCVTGSNKKRIHLVVHGLVAEHSGERLGGADRAAIRSVLFSRYLLGGESELAQLLNREAPQKGRHEVEVPALRTAEDRPVLSSYMMTCQSKANWPSMVGRSLSAIFKRCMGRRP